MRHRQSYEDDRTAVSSHDSGQQTGREDDQMASPTVVQTKATGVVLPEEHQVKHLDQQKGERYQHQHNDDKGSHLIATHLRKAPQTPDNIATYILIVAKELEHTDDCIRYVADHHTHDQ